MGFAFSGRESWNHIIFEDQTDNPQSQAASITFYWKMDNHKKGKASASPDPKKRYALCEDEDDRQNVPISQTMEELALDGNVKGDEKVKKVKIVSKSKSPKRQKEGKDNTADDLKREKGIQAASPTNQRKETESAMIVEGGRAPPTMVIKIVELGLEPLFEDLRPKLDAFKSDAEFKRRAENWNLIDKPKKSSKGMLEARDYSHLTPEDLYKNFMSTVMSQGGREFEDFLEREYDDVSSWECMTNFEVMKKETTTYKEFMRLFEDNIGMIKNTPFGRNNTKNVAGLEKCFAKYWDPVRKKPKQLKN